MPEIEIQHVVSFNTADKNNPAENLLKADGSHRWRSAAPGEKAVSCVLQLAKSSQIHSIDIGNEGSAFVEVLVGKAAAASDKDFEVLLVASSFMSPLDSRNGTNRTSVRMFGPEKLNKVTAAQKWDRVKIVCTQPFSKTSQYGLSFIKFHSPPDAKSDESKPKKLGAFTLKPASDDEDDDIRVGSLFANRGKPETTPSPAGVAATMRAAGRLAEEHYKTGAATTVKATPTKPPQPVGDATAGKRKISPPLPETSKKAKTSRDAKDSDTEDEEEEKEKKPPLRKQSTSVSSTASSKRDETSVTSSALKRSRTEPVSTSPTKEFRSLMEGVVFVLSGFQNPFRAELRDKAMEMGAKYRPDWGKGCTHLICAFQNTPKYQQVSGKGKIVTKSWILDSHKMKKLLPWRKYRLGDAESPDESSEEEEDERPKPVPKVKAPLRKKASEEKKQEQRKDDGAKPRGALPKKGVSFDSGSDTDKDSDNEVEKNVGRKPVKKAVKEQTKEEKEEKKQEDEADPYDVATDEEVEDIGGDGGGSDSGLPDLPDFFSDRHFFFYGDFDAADRRLLTRYVAAYNGEEEDYMSAKVNYVVTAQKWDDNFDEALSENPHLVFVKPKWIFACQEKGKLVPHQPFIVVPQ